MERIWTKVGYRLQISKQDVLANHTSFVWQTNTSCYLHEGTNGVLLKHQKGILNYWKEYFCELLNPETVQHLEIFEKQINEKIYLIEAKVSTAIKSLTAGKAPGEDDI